MELLSPLFTASSRVADPVERALLTVAIGFTLVALVVTVLMILAVVTLRLIHNADERRRLRDRERWEPLLFQAMTTEVEAPRIDGRERVAFLKQWALVQSHIREEESDNLNRLARAMGLETDALALVRSRSLEKRFLAVRVLARLRESRGWADLERLLRAPVPALALGAAQALVRIDPARAFPAVVPVLRLGREWAPAQVAQILNEGGEHARQALAQILKQLHPGEARHLIRLLAIVQNSVMLPVLRERLPRVSDPEVLAEILYALGRLGGAEDRETITRHLSHQDWVVRLKAAQALGMIGTRNDELWLIPLLSDPYWWVRYRAAEALARLPGMNPAQLRAIRESLPERDGRDALAQIIAEQEAL
jgi:HEAT repeat protein